MALSFLRLGLVIPIEERTELADEGELDSDGTESGPRVRRWRRLIGGPGCCFLGFGT